MNFEKQSRLKRKLINQTLNLGKKYLKRGIKFNEKIINFSVKN